MEMPKDKIFIVFSQTFCYKYTVSKPVNDVNKLPPWKAIWCLYQANLGPAPSLAIVAIGYRLLTAVSWLLCRAMERLQNALMNKLTP